MPFLLPSLPDTMKPNHPDRYPPAVRVVLLASLALLGVLAAAADAGLAEEEPLLHAVEIQLDEDIGRPLDLDALLDFAPGERLTEDKIRRTLANCHATGLISQAEVLVRDEPEGKVAVVVLRTQTWVDEVILEGDSGLRKADLLRVIEHDAGDPLAEGRLLRSVFALQDLYEENGYRQATVRLVVEERTPGKRVAVRFRVASGSRTTVSQIVLVGELEPGAADELRKALATRSGDAYDRDRLRADAGRLRRALVKRGHLQAEVEGPEMQFIPGEPEVDVTFHLEPGPVIEVEVVGAEKEKLVKKGLLPFLDDQIYDETLVGQSVAAIRTHFQRQGYFLAKVRSREEQADGRTIRTIEVEPGEVYKVGEIRFTGNQHVASGELMALMETTTRPFLGLGGGRLVGETLREDLDVLRSFYALQGFAEMEIGPAEVRTEEQELKVTIPIVEGPRQRVVELELVGFEFLDPGAVRRQLPLSRGGPFHPVLLEESINLLRALYEDRGFGGVLVTPRLDWNAERTLVDVVLAVQEGRRQVVDRVILRGHRHTRPEVLRRFAGLEEGEAISRRRLLEVERDLYRLGIFSRVDVEPAPTADPSGRRDVLIHLEEGRRWHLSYGGSYHSDDGLGALAGLSRINLRGHGDRLQLDLRANERDRRFRLIYDQPSLGPLDLPMTYTLFRQDEERDAFTVRDLGVQAALTKDFPRVRLGLTYDYRLVELLEIRVDPGEIERQDRELEISSITPNLFIDRRDDPLEPTKGFLTAIQLEYAFPFISATASFAKLFVQQTGYRSLGRFGVLAASLRLGAIEPLDDEVTPDPLLPADLANALVPVSERFFAGGRTTHRAYERDELGIPGETLFEFRGDLVESGGNGLVLLNVDYRFPIVGDFGGTVFFDLGNVWADWRDFEPEDLEPGLGVGLRYRSPIGPVRLEVGWKLNREEGEESPVFFLSLGNPF